jgi:hypothetical protein
MKPIDWPKEAHSICSILEHFSDDYYCASWLVGIEHEVWEKLIKPDPVLDTDPEETFYWSYPRHEIELLQKLSATCKGWVRFAGEEDCHRAFVPMEEWIRLHAEHMGAEMTEDQRKVFELFMGGPERDKAAIKKKELDKKMLVFRYLRHANGMEWTIERDWMLMATSLLMELDKIERS